MSVYDQPRPKARRVFISYSSIDRLRTNGLGLLLEAMGHQVFHDHRTIRPGMKWKAALQDGLDDADVLMVFWTKHASRSDWVRKEYEYFHANYPERVLVPVLADETPLTEILKTRQHADFAPVVNEVLEMKRSMKKEGAGARQIEEAVLKRLEGAGVTLDTKKQRRMLFLFLGFNWLLTLLRQPGATFKRVGSGAVEKGAQLTAGQVAAIGLAAVIGLASGVPVAEQLAEPDLIEKQQVLAPDDETLPITAAAADESARPVDSDEGATTPPPEEPSASLSSEAPDYGVEFARISGRLDQIWTRVDELAECRLELELLSRSLPLLESGELVAAGDDSLDESGEELAADATTGADETAGPDEAPGGGEIVTITEGAGGAQVSYVRPVGEGDFEGPRILSAPDPVYPVAARRLGIAGTVVVVGVIDREGGTEVTEVMTDGRAGQEVLALAAERAVRRWRFEAGTLNGEPVPVDLRVRVRFR